ncbi:MAG: transcriptional repressor [Gammaproteobacteria bacterium]|nr:transcriptional repressor [Gammaproteobacteria bacterium]MCP5202333.1 transcriptional repressor [Gammaproteobacteria bacterium]
MSELATYPPVSRDEIPGLLHGHGITPTQQRVEIAAILLECRQHLSADQVIARLGEADASVSKATVYNTLGLFARRGLVREVMVDATRVFYDSNTAPHHHFFDVDDGELTDFPSDAVKIEGLPALPPGTVADSVEVVIRVRKPNR